jgi:hypothetical protein
VVCYITLFDELLTGMFYIFTILRMFLKPKK